MPRAKRGFKARQRRNKIMKAAKGYYSSRGRTYRSAIHQVHNAWDDAYAHRRQKKRNFRRLWIARINAAARLNGMSYSRFIAAMKKANVDLDRKVLADLALNDPGGFAAVVKAVQA